MKDLQLLSNALDVANKAGVFNLQDSGNILNALSNIGNSLQKAKELGAQQKQPGEVEAEMKPTPKKLTKK